MDMATSILMEVGDRCFSILTTTVPWSSWFLRVYWRELCCALVGALVWTITQPLRSVSGRLLAAFSLLLDQWTGLGLLCFQRYRRYVNKPSVRNKPRCNRYWIMFEAFWVTPMVHEDGLGRLLHTWLEAYHALWCVFFPDLLEYSLKSTRKYANGIRMERWRSSSCAWWACKWVWTLSYVLLFGHFYLLGCSYEMVEWLCMGWQMMGILLLVLNYCFASSDEVLQGDLSTVHSTVLLVSLFIMLVAVVSHVWKWLDCGEDKQSPSHLVRERYALYCKDIKEQEQAERLSEAFWRLDGGTDDVMSPVLTVSGIRAEQRKMRAKTEAAKHREALRGRQAKVGEDVTCGTDGHRLGNRSESPHAVIQVADDIWDDQVVVEARVATPRRPRSGTRVADRY
ncbi:hypothetical protein PHMEG_00037329 [Phytophthora megakarya]|uniref:Transmembrane protein n=1 Tax=Phytophthora megakarya TaxID=4795 RepID=A0A225UJC8_9STRA|nr:hypothetical protein PHMEG_00037329 [Phytophthora megakarya]